MKLWIRILSVVLFVVFSIMLLVACGSENSSTSSDENLPTSSEESAEGETVDGIPLSSLSEYTIVRSKSADLTQKETIYAMKRELDALLGCELPLRGDGESPSSLEILVGETNRPESVAFMDSLRYQDCGFAVIGNKIVVGGHSQEALELATENFLGALAEATKEEKAVLAEGEYVTRATYAFEDTLVCGLSSKNLSVVYADQKGKDFALLLAESLSQRCGYVVRAISQRESASATGNLLLLGVSGQRGLTAPEEFEPAAAYVQSASDAVLLAGGEYGFERLCYSLLADVLSGTGNSVPLPSPSGETGDLLRTVSYNVLVSQRSAERVAALMDSIRRMKPDTVGLQEASGAWMEDFASHLPEYASVGIGRSGKNSEGTYILYRKDKFTLVDSATFWLSDTPDRESKYDESSYPRICTYALLRRISDGKMFLHVNTHLEHTSAVARDKQIAVLLKQIKMLGSYPTVVTGDFNCTSESNVYATMSGAGYKDSASLALLARTAATFRSSGKVIDFCFATSESVQILHYGVFDGKVNDIYPSDHNSVYVDFVLK